jgi:hypothetical protein
LERLAVQLLLYSENDLLVQHPCKNHGGSNQREQQCDPSQIRNYPIRATVIARTCATKSQRVLTHHPIYSKLFSERQGSTNFATSPSHCSTYPDRQERFQRMLGQLLVRLLLAASSL